MRDKVRHWSDLSQINCDDHFFVGQEESWDDLDFTRGGDHAVDPSLWERVELLVFPAIIIIINLINNQLSISIIVFVTGRTAYPPCKEGGTEIMK